MPNRPAGSIAAEPELSRRNEPKLKMGNIQGNIVPGFNKDFQTLLFFEIAEPEKFRPAIAALADHVTTAEQVLAFRHDLKEAEAAGRTAPTETWMNLAFSFPVLQKLRPDASGFADAAFREGMGQRSHLLGDPQDPATSGRPMGWEVSDDTAHLMVIVAADDPADGDKKVEEICDLIGDRGATKLPHSDKGFVLRGPRDEVIEHFGYRDGISQPGVRGFVEGQQDVPITPRDSANPNAGKRGKELVWPGEFVFGHPGQDGRLHSGKADWMIGGDGFRIAPDWARDGSYLVFRRLRQHVHRFHQSLNSLKGAGEDGDLAGARIIGRWPSGAPIIRAPKADDPNLAGDDFEFKARAVNVCPGSAHIRKVNPRGELELQRRLKHRMLRRGITFGPKSDSRPESPLDDGEVRGLLFLAYMTSIKYQFEFVMRSWANREDFRSDNAGVDALLNSELKWIEPTGGGYYFAPSKSALTDALSALGGGAARSGKLGGRQPSLAR